MDLDPCADRLAAPAVLAVAALNPVVARADPTASLWERMADQRLHLRDTVSVHEHRYRGRAWYLLRDTLGKQQYRLSRGVYQLIARLDGRQTLSEAYARFAAGRQIQGEPTPELLTTLTQLHAAGMLAADLPTDVGPLIARQRQQRRKQNLSRWLRLLSPRMRLVDPDRFLERSLPWAGWFFRPVALLAWLMLTAVAGLQALMHWDALALYGAQRLDDPQSWLLLVCAYPLVKALHELGHGFAAKSAGAEVNEMGITLLVFLPVPYVDASAASVIENKYRRMLVGAAGIIVELLLAALAMFAWLQLPDGLLREAAFAVMLIGGVSTLLFNGNPLLRFDGYYVLSDAIEIPNLATRAGRYYGYLARRYVLGLSGERAPGTVKGERAWLLFFGAASTLYRLSITIGIALFLISVVPTLGVADGGLANGCADRVSHRPPAELPVVQPCAGWPALTCLAHGRRSDHNGTVVTGRCACAFEQPGQRRGAVAGAGDRACRCRRISRPAAGRARPRGAPGRCAVRVEQSPVGDRYLDTRCACRGI